MPCSCSARASVSLLGVGEAVERGLLVRVLAVAEVLHLLEEEAHVVGEERPVRPFGGTREVAVDGVVVCARLAEDLHREAHAGREAVVAPPFARISARMASYSSGFVTTVTAAKFFAAERSMEGPPMSMFSTASSSVTPSFATVASNA